MHKKHLSALALTAAMLLTSCASAPFDTSESPDETSRPQNVSTTTPIEPDDMTAEEWLKSVRQIDCEGYEFTIATSSPGRFIDYESSDNAVNMAITKRNDLVEARYNIKLREKHVQREAEIINSVQNSVASGTQYSDLVSASIKTLAVLAADSCLTSLYSLPYYDADAAFTVPSLREAATAGSTSYITFDELTLAAENAYCLFFNKEQTDAKAIYDAAQKGWTWETLASLKGSAVISSVQSSEETARLIFSTYGISPLTSGHRQPLSHNTDTAALDNAAHAVAALMSQLNFAPQTSDDAEKQFKNGTAAFLIAPVSFITQISDTSLDFGLVTLPSPDGVTRSPLSKNTCGIAVPAKQKNSDRTGLLLTALTAASHQHIYEAQLQNHLYFNLRDNESSLMLQKIYDTLYLDIGTVYSAGYSAIEASSTAAITEAIKGKSFADIFAREKAQLDSVAAKYFR